MELYGSLGGACGFYDVQIDGGEINTYNASRDANYTDYLIFLAANLGSGQHTMKVTNSAVSNATLVIDHAVSHIVDTSGRCVVLQITTQ